MDRLEAMAMLIEAIDRGSLSAASRSRRVPLTTLSRQISELEATLGVKLLIRTTRRLALTDVGAGYLAAARQIIEQVGSAEREAAGELAAPKGELVVGASVLFGRLFVLPIVTEFLATYPEINVNLLLSDRNAHLVDEHIDMAVRIGELTDNSLIATRVGSMRTVTCASPDLLHEFGVPKRPDELAQLPCIANAAPAPSPGWTFLSGRPNAPLKVSCQPRLTVTTPCAAADAALRGVGSVRLLHYQVADAVEQGKLRIVLDRFEPPPAPVHPFTWPRAAKGRSSCVASSTTPRRACASVSRASTRQLRSGGSLS